MPKLLCVVIDGLHTDTLACAHIPFYDQLSRIGTQVRQITLPQPCLTLPVLVSLFTSLPPQEHGVLSNSGTSLVSPHAVSLFSLLRYRNQNSAAFYSNDRLRLLFPTGTLHTAMLINSQGLRNVDHELAEQAARHLQREKPDCCFVYLQGADITGSHFGFFSEAYRESIEQADRALGLLLEHLDMVGSGQEYVFMVLGCSGSPLSRSNGVRDAAPGLPLLLAGPGIPQGEQVDEASSLLDLAPTMASILGLAPHPDWQGGVIEALCQRQPSPLKPLEIKQTNRNGNRREERAA